MLFSPTWYCSIFLLPIISFGATDVRKDVRDVRCLFPTCSFSILEIKVGEYQQNSQFYSVIYSVPEQVINYAIKRKKSLKRELLFASSAPNHDFYSCFYLTFCHKSHICGNIRIEPELCQIGHALNVVRIGIHISFR